MKKVLSLLLVAVFVLVMFTGCSKTDYNEAVKLMESGDYEQAITLFTELGDYNDSQEKLVQAQKFLSVKKALNEGTWFFEATSVNAVYCLQFADGSATISNPWFDGNGYHEGADTTQHTYKITDTEIKLINEDGTEKVIPYTFENDTLKLADDYFTPEMVKEALQGHWSVRRSQYLLGSLTVDEHHILFEDDKATYENASKARGYYDGTYYYYGPYTGTYEIGLGKFETDMDHGDRWFFRIADGEVQLMYYGNACIKADTNELPGEDGYSF